MSFFMKNKILKKNRFSDTLGLEKRMISIIIPCFNARDTLGRTLLSIQQSSHKNLEVLLIDDGSEETVEELVKSFKDNRFRYFWKNNEGPGLARNYGLDNALGDYIFFLDSDDEIYHDALTNLLTYALEENLDVVSGVTVRKSFETGIESEWFRRLYKEKRINTLKDRLSLYDDALTTNKLYNIEFLKNNKIRFPPGLYEDKVFTAQLYSTVDRLGLITDRVYIWYVYGQATSISTSKNISNFKERMLAIYNTWQYLPELRRYYQFSAFFNHDLVIYLREFIYYSSEEKRIIFDESREFVLKYQIYFYERLLTISLHRGCFNALLQNDYNRFEYISNIISELYQENLKKKERV